MTFLEDGIIAAHNLGLTDVLLPFLVVFMVTFGVLHKTRILGNLKNERVINAVVAFVLGFFFIFNEARVAAMNEILIKLALLLVMSVMIQIVVAAFGAEYEWAKSRWVLPIIFAVLAVLFAISLDWFDLGELVVIVAFVKNPAFIVSVLFVLIIWYITRGEGMPGKGGQAKAETDMREQRPKQQTQDAPEIRRLRPELERRITQDELARGEGDLFGKRS